IPAGSRSQSVPGPGELPQSFETSDDLDARSKWNNLQVRLTQPQTKATILQGLSPDPDRSVPRIFLKGISTNLQPGDPILIDFGSIQLELFRVAEVKPDPVAGRTRVNLQAWSVAGAPKLKSVGESVAEVLTTYQQAVKSGKLTNLALAKKADAAIAD